MTMLHLLKDTARDVILLPLLLVAGVVGWAASYLQTEHGGRED